MQNEHQQNDEQAHSNISQTTPPQTSDQVNYDYYGIPTGEPDAYEQFVKTHTMRANKIVFDFEALPHHHDEVFITQNEQQQNYEQARSEICRITQSETSGLASYLDYYCNATEEPAAYKQMVEAFQYRVGENLFDVDSDSYHSLASQQGCKRIYTALAKKLLGMENKIAEHAKKENDGYILHDFARTKEEVLETQRNFDAFEQQFAAEIAAEKRGNSFVNDNAMINKTLDEMRSAISGTWKPECVEITDGEGTRRPAELPGSSRFSRIAKTSKTKRQQLLALKI